MKNKKKILCKIGIVFLWIIAWQLFSMWVNQPLLLASPIRCARELWKLLPTVAFWQAAGGSVFRILTGFAAGAVCACLLAAIAFRIKIVEEMFAPVVILIKAVPVASFVVMLLIWWGSSGLTMAVCFLVALPILYTNVLEGFKQTDVKLLEMAKVFRMPVKNCFFYIRRPALRPYVESGIRLAIGMCFKAGVAAELIGTPQFSIGERLYMSKIYLDTAGVFAWTCVVIVLSAMLEKCVMYAVKCFFRWEPKCVGKQIQRNPIETIVLKNACKSYGEKIVLDNLNCVYEAGSRQELRTPSGSGKTTLLRVIAGLEKLDSGTVEGVLQCSFQFQEDRLAEDYSAVKNVAMVTGDEEGARRALAELLEPEALDKPSGQLSGGMKRRVSLVRAMEATAQCVLLDEPYTGLDEESLDRVKQYIDAKIAGRTLVIATHI